VLHRTAVTTLLLGLLLGGAASAQAAKWQVCLHDAVGLNAPARASFDREFSLLLAPHDMRFAWSSCRAGGEAIHLAVRFDAPQPYSNVLGLAYKQSGAISPRVEIFLDPMLDLMKDTQCWTVIGRALARVAAHEITHFTEQRDAHDAQGLMKAGFSSTELSSDDSQLFCWRRRAD
jgi:hypothetical protein